MNASSAAKIAQITQFAANANVRHVCDFASRSMMTTGIIASVATRTIGSNGGATRPEGPCRHTSAVFALLQRFPSFELRRLRRGPLIFGARGSERMHEASGEETRVAAGRAKGRRGGRGEQEPARGGGGGAP